MPTVEFQSATKFYGGRRALEGLSFSLEAGTAFGLLGPNGAGKTTAVKILLGLVRPTSGRALLSGRQAGHPAGRRRTGYLPENPAIPNHLTGREFLRLQAALAGLRGPEISDQVSACLARVKLEDQQDVRAGKYSKGMKQRLGLAAALLARPEILILDEPSSGLDPRGIHEVRALLEELHGGGATIFLNSHLLSEVEKICTHAAILNQGRLVACDTVKNLCRPDETLEAAFLRLVPES